jgi:hypothetical protein
MDFADATLVYLAARESLSLILTVDHDDFETYRIGGRKRFSILPNAVSQMYQGQPKRFTPCQPAHLVNSRKSQRGIRPTAKLRG